LPELRPFFHQGETVCFIKQVFQSLWENSETVAAAWASTPTQADPCRVLDHKFRNVAKELRRWSNAQVGSVRLQLALAREAILVYDTEMESRQLEPWEADIRRALKMRVLGLTSFSRCLARQRARVLFLREGDANTRFYHLQARHRNRRGRIESLDVHGMHLVNEEEKATALYEYLNGIMGTNFECSRRFNLQALGIPVEELHDLERLFSEDEVWAVIQQMPSDKVPGPDGFTADHQERRYARHQRILCSSGRTAGLMGRVSSTLRRRSSRRCGQGGEWPQSPRPCLAMLGYSIYLGLLRCTW
jgi:hypothetical protein